MKAEARRKPPMAVQLDAAKRQIVRLMQGLGLIPAGVDPDSVTLQCDHDPALGLRDVDPLTGAHIPHQHDARFLVFREVDAHARKTRGAGATTSESDVGEMRKTRQLVRARIDRGDVSPDDPSIAPWAPKSPRRRPKRAFPPGRPLQSRNSFKDRRP